MKYENPFPFQSSPPSTGQGVNTKRLRKHTKNTGRERPCRSRTICRCQGKRSPVSHARLLSPSHKAFLCGVDTRRGPSPSLGSSVTWTRQRSSSICTQPCPSASKSIWRLYQALQASNMSMLAWRAVHMSPCQDTISLLSYKYHWGQSPCPALRAAAKGQRHRVRPGVKRYPQGTSW